MNHTYKVVWSRAKGVLVVASELSSSQAKGRAKGSSVVVNALGGVSLAAMLSVAGVLAPGGDAYAQAACSTSPCAGTDVYKGSVGGQINGTFTFNQNSALIGDIEDVVASFTTADLRGNSVASLTIANALGGASGRLAAFDNAQINVEVAGAVSGGTIHINNNSVLNVNASGGIAGGVQQIAAGAQMRLNAANAIAGGEQQIQGTLRVQAADGITNARQEVAGGRLEVAAAGAIRDSSIHISNGGRVVVETDQGFGDSVGVDLYNDPTLGAGVLDLQSNATVISLNGRGGIVQNTGSGKSTLTVATADGTASAFDGVIEDGSGGVALVKGGEGTLRLGGVNTYTGGTTVLGGTLEGTTNSLSGDIINEASLLIKQDFHGTSSANFSGGGRVTVASSNGNGRVHLAGNNTHMGGTQVDNAELTVSNNTALGTGAVTLQNGSLMVLDDKTSTHVFNQNINIIGAGQLGGATASLTDSMTVEFSGVISGAGNLTIAQQGSNLTTVRLSGMNSYTNTYVQSGTLIGNSDSIKGNVTNAGVVIYEQSADGVALGNMSGAGVFTKMGAGNLRLSGNSSVNWQVGAGTLTATAQQFTGDINIGGGAAFAFYELIDDTYGGVISGSGTLLKQGGGKLTLTGDSSGFAGLTTVQAGDLIVNTSAGGKLGGTLSVLNGAKLKGSGRVGTTELDDGAVVAPGNSIGTLTVDGNLTFNANSIYEVEVDPASSSSDLIVVTGTANLAGRVEHVGFNGTYLPEASYTILSAGAISGKFDSATSNYAFLTPTLEYDTTAVKMKLTRNGKPIGGEADSGNGSAAGGGVGSVGGEHIGSIGGNGVGAGSPDALTANIYNAVVVLPTEEVAGALELLSGEIHASTTSALLNSSRLASEVSVKHLRGHFDAAPVRKVRSDVASWVEVVGQRASLKGDYNASKVDHSLAGLFLGGHVDVGAGWRLGGSFGYTDGKVEIDDKLSKADVKTYSALIFGGNSFGLGRGKLNVLAGASYSWHKIDTQRSVVFPGVNERLKADYKANTAQVFGEVGYAIPVAETMIVEPFLGVEHTRHRAKSFSESGGISALNAESKTNAFTSTTLGLRSKTGFTLGKTQGIVTATVGWRHATGDLSPVSSLSFAGGNQFSVAGAPITKNGVVAELGVSFGISNNTSLGVSYSGQYGGGNKDTAGSLSLRVRY